MALLARFRRRSAPAHRSARREVPIETLRKRYYEAAQQSDLHFGWDTLPVPTPWLIRNSLRVLRARAREQVQNNDYAKRFLGLLASNVVGAKGFTFQAQIKNSAAASDDQANRFMEAMMRDWSRRENFCATGKLSRTDHERLFIRTVAQDGEYLARIIRGRQAGPHGIQIQVLDPETLPVWYEKDLGAGAFIQSGVEFSALGRPLAYHVEAASTRDDSYSYFGRQLVRIPAADVIHEFVTELVNQYRGIPWLATSLTGLKMLGGYEEAALVAARVGAASMGFFKSNMPDDLPADSVSATGEPEMDAEAGTFRVLPPGMDVAQWNPRYPDSQFAGFVKSQLRRVASGLGANYNTLANDLEGVNYSSLRQGALEDRDWWSLIQDWMISVFNERLYREWIRWQMTTAGATLPMKMPASLTILNEPKYLDVRWLPRRWQWVDPQKEMTANIAALVHGLKSRSQIIREMGHDPEALWREIKRENAVLAALGLSFALEQPGAESLTERVED